MSLRKDPCAAWPGWSRLRVAPSLLVGAVSIFALTSIASAQAINASMDSWDTPRSLRPDASSPVVSDELVVGVLDWSARDAVIREAADLGDSVLGAIPRLFVMRIRLGGGASWPAHSVNYLSCNGVTYVQPDILLAPDSASPPSDPDFTKEWQLDNSGQSGGKPGADIEALNGWEIASGDTSVTVAVLDSGCDLTHPEFAGRLVPGWDFVDEDPDPSAVGDHGTYVTGLLGANADNGIEIAGVDKACRIMPIRVLAGGTTFDLAQGLDFAATKGVDVVTMSLGYPADLPYVDSALAEVAASGAVLVASAGNSDVSGYADSHWPAASPLVLSVGWTTQADFLDPESATGTTLDVVAPGKNVVTVSPDGSGQSSKFSGSSAATPLVAGILSVMKGLNRHLSASQLKESLIKGAEDQVGNPSHDKPGWDPYFGWGRVNLRRSLEALCGCQGGESLTAIPQHVSVSSGEVLALRVDFGSDHAGQPYWILGTASGPGAWKFGSVTLPLTVDDYTRFTVTDADGPILGNTHGILDGAGQATAYLFLPQDVALLAPAVLNHVAVAFRGRATPADAVIASNLTTTMIDP